MAWIAVITDSSACLPSGSASSLRIRSLPITIHLSSEDVLDGEDDADRLVYEALSRGEPVKSSAPSALEYLTAIEEADASGVVVITPAAEFTGMFRTASTAAAVANVPVAVLDSRTAAAAQGLVAIAAAEAASEGGSLDDVVHAAEDAARRAELVASLETVEMIQRSGRVPPAAFSLARRLGVRPVFRLSGGTVERLAIPLSAETALRRIRQEWVARGGTTALRSTVFHAARPDRAAEVAAVLGPPQMITEFSPSMGIHTGPGVVGVAWLRGPD